MENQKQKIEWISKNVITTHRNPFIDELKGIAILLVIIGHVLQFVFKVNFSGFAFATIYSFHMAFFMFLAGYSLSLGHQQLQFSYVTKRMLSLFTPFIVWGGIYTCIRYRNSPLESLINMLKFPDYGLWFLYVLAYITFFIYLGQKLSVFVKNDAGYVIVALILIALNYVFKTSLFGFNLVTIHYVFFFLGYTLKHYWNEKSNDFKSLVKIVSLILFVNLLIFWRFPSHFVLEEPIFDFLRLKNVPKSVLHYEKIKFFILKNYVIQIAGTVSLITVYKLSNNFFPKKLKSAIANLGKHTLEIYAVHIIILYDLPIVFFNVYIDAIAKFSLAIIIPIFIGYILSLNKYSAYVFLGKQIKK